MTALTAVQLRRDTTITARLVFGAPVGSHVGALGEIALLPAGQIAAYLVETTETTGFYLFRTGVRSREPLAAIPGVHPSVRLFLASPRRALVTRTRNFLRKLTSYGYDHAALSDAFWTRAAGALAARTRISRQLLPYLLQREIAP
jgi:hypothetical protein